MMATAWRLTGRSRLRRRLWWRTFEVEEARRAFRPRYTGHTPGNWRREERFRKATPEDLVELQRLGAILLHDGRRVVGARWRTAPTRP